MRCECGYQTCTNCSEFVDHTMEHEPTGHAWIKTTNKYYKRTAFGKYEKGIITFGRTYVCFITYKPVYKSWVLDVLADGCFVVQGARCLKISIAINAGSDIIKHLIASDINRKPRQETRNSKLETWHPNLDGSAEPIGLAMEVQP
jgi:hypothetical protein